MKHCSNGAGAPSRARAWLGVLTVAAGGYLTFLLTRYFFPPHLPRRRLESVFFFLIAFGVLSVLARAANRRASLKGSHHGSPLSHPRRPLSTAQAAVVFAILGGVAWLTYRSVMDVGLLSDDFVVADFARRHHWVYGIDLAFARPLVPMLWAALEHAPMAFDRAVHATNIALHAVNALLVAISAARMGMPRLQSVAAGLLFIVSPGLTESVAWATGIHDVLMASFVLTAVVSTTLVDRGVWWSVAAIAATLLALGAKETAVVAPALAALVLWASGVPIGRGRTGWTLGLMFGATAAYIAWRVGVGLPPAYGEDIYRVYFVKQLIVGPFAALGAPWTVGWAAAHPVRSFLRAAILVALTTIALLMWHARAPQFKRAVAAAAWVLMGILPVFSLFYVGPSLEGSRYLYLSAAGFALLVSILAGTTAGAFPWLFRAPVFVAAMLAVALPVVPAFRYELRRWHEAARVRDAILARAKAEPSLLRCDSFVAIAAADNVDGAFVFHNGLMQALAIDDRRGAGQPAGGGACRIGWTGSDLTVMR